MIKHFKPIHFIHFARQSEWDETPTTVKKLSRLYFMIICIEQDYGAGLFVANLQSIIEKQCEQEVKAISASRRYKYKINRNISLASLKNRILKLFIQSDNNFEILIELQNLFIKNVEPVRPGRHPPRPLPKRKRGKYQTFTNYRRAI